MARIVPRLVRTLRVSALLVFSAGPALAVTAVSNLSEAMFGNSPVSDGQAIAAGFVTGGDPTVLDSVALLMDVTAVPGDATFAVSIFDDSSFIPGSLVANGLLSGSNSPSVAGLYTYTATGTVSLAANTRYWVVASKTGPGAFNWTDTASTSETSAIGWTIEDLKAFTTSSGSWAYSSGFPRLSVEVVPEPATAALLCLGLAGLTLAGRRRTPR